MAAPQKREIELLPQETWEKTSLGKFLKWTLNVGRYVVIITELIVILAFLSRFKLDRDLTNLHEEIKQKQEVIEASRNFEDEFRFLQTRLTTIASLKQNQSITADIVEEISSLIPIEVTLSKIAVEEKQVKLTASALSEAGLASFLNNLKASPKFEKLSLSNLSSGAEKGPGILFELNGEYLPIKEDQKN